MALVDRILDPRTRLAGFLGCLVASMTFGAAVLLWIEPVGLDPTQPVVRLASLEEIHADVTATESPVRPGRWTGIRFAQHVVDRSRTLAARTDRTDAAGRQPYHFLVDLTGRIFPTESWRTQQGSGQATGAIRVVLTHREANEEVSPAQDEALRRLIETLRSTCDIPAEQVERVTESVLLSGDPEGSPSVPT